MENPDKTDFEKAVLYAMQQLSPLFVGGELKPGQRQPSELFWVIMLQLRGGQDEIGNFYVLREEDDQVLYAMADKDRGAFDLYRKIIADRVDRHALLSLPMKDFHWRLLHDKIKAPKGQTTKAKNFELNLRVVYIADYLADNFALPKFGNSTGPQISVCDAISAAFWRLGDKSKKSRSIQDLLLHKLLISTQN